MGVSVSTGLTYLQQPELKQLLTCVWQMPGHFIKTQALSLKRCTEHCCTVILSNFIIYSYFSHKVFPLTAYDHTFFGWSKPRHNLLSSDWMWHLWFQLMLTERGQPVSPLWKHLFHMCHGKMVTHCNFIARHSYVYLIMKPVLNIVLVFSRQFDIGKPTKMSPRS